MPRRYPHRLLHPSCIHILRWSLKRSVKQTWTGSTFSTDESAWSVMMVMGPQSRVWSGPKVSKVLKQTGQMHGPHTAPRGGIMKFYPNLKKVRQNMPSTLLFRWGFYGATTCNKRAGGKPVSNLGVGKSHIAPCLLSWTLFSTCGYRVHTRLGKLDACKSWQKLELGPCPLLSTYMMVSFQRKKKEVMIK
jgi:hypothetical protein